jgi:hypothetical protein
MKQPPQGHGIVIHVLMKKPKPSPEDDAPKEPGPSGLLGPVLNFLKKPGDKPVKEKPPEEETQDEPSEEPDEEENSETEQEGEQETEGKSEKIKRDAFIYLNGTSRDFAQCGSCWLFVPEKQRCSILGPKVEVDADDSCCFYMKGKPVKGLPIVARVSIEEAGFVERKVRCENCFYGGGGDCQLYVELNEKFPDMFDLDTSITSKSCCNAQIPKQK